MMAEAEVGVITASLQAAVEKEVCSILPIRRAEVSQHWAEMWRKMPVALEAPSWRNPRLRAQPRSSAAHRRDHSHRRQDDEGCGCYDLTRLMIGSEGTLGIVTKVTVELLPLPRAKKTMLVVFDDFCKASETVVQVFMAGVIPTTMELLDNIYIRAIEDYVHLGLPVEAEAVLLIEVDGDEVALGPQIELVRQICISQGATSVQVAKNAKEADDLWVARRSAFAAVARVKPTIIGEDCTVQRDKVPQMVRQIRAIAEKHEVIIAVLGHAGDGNLHATLLADERDKNEMERIERAIDEILTSTLAMGGTLTGEHGIGRVKRKFLPIQLGEGGMANAGDQTRTRSQQHFESRTWLWRLTLCGRTWNGRRFAALSAARAKRCVRFSGRSGLSRR